MWNHNGSKQSPFERLPILPQANEQEKGNEVCIMVLFVGMVRQRERKHSVDSGRFKSLAREPETQSTCMAGDIFLKGNIDWPQRVPTPGRCVMCIVLKNLCSTRAEPASKHGAGASRVVQLHF